jgi:hypothetical protein
MQWTLYLHILPTVRSRTFRRVEEAHSFIHLQEMDPSHLEVNIILHAKYDMAPFWFKTDGLILVTVIKSYLTNTAEMLC